MEGGEEGREDKETFSSTLLRWDKVVLILKFLLLLLVFRPALSFKVALHFKLLRGAEMKDCSAARLNLSSFRSLCRFGLPVPQTSLVILFAARM